MPRYHDNKELQACAEAMTAGPTDYYRPQRHGPITGSGPGFDKAMRQFERRQRELKRVGKWRYRRSYTRDHGRYIDVDYYLTDWDYLI